MARVEDPLFVVGVSHKGNVVLEVGGVTASFGPSLARWLAGELIGAALRVDHDVAKCVPAANAPARGEG